MFVRYCIVLLPLIAGLGVMIPTSIARASDVERFGTVNFPVGCAPSASVTMEQAVAQLHHMMYANARTLFREAETADPECAIALWGIAMTYIHPLWPDRPSPEVLIIGADLAARAAAIGGHDAREEGYIATTSAYFEYGENLSEEERLLKFESSWQALHQANPADLEAQAFFALAQLARVEPGDKSYAKQLRAGAMAEAVLLQVPDHPGAHHYIIHAYDFPGLAERALPVARNYGVVGPEVPHALHMMSHIFTRLGLWDESIEWNRRSANAAWQLGEEAGAISLHYQHAMDYLAYAYLQTGEDDLALGVVKDMASLTPPFSALNRDAQAFALAAVPARYALERRDWEAAASLESRNPAEFPWEQRHAPYVALTHFARGMGLAHESRFEEAWQEVATLAEIRNNAQDSAPYWANQVEIQRLSVEAWNRYLGGDSAGGLNLMRKAARLEAGTEKSPVTPGEVLPAAELLGDMLYSLKKYDEALATYRLALERSPRRLNSLYGAGQALERMGDPEAAGAYYAEIAGMANETSPRASVEYALEY